MIDDRTKFANQIKNHASTQEFTYSCKDCGKTVSMTLGELLFYDANGLIVPCRCNDCKNEKNKRITEGVTNA